MATRGSTGRPLFLLAATAVLAASLRTAKLLAGAFFAEVRVVVFVWVCDNALAGDFSVIVITLQGHVFGDGLHEIRVALGDQLRGHEYQKQRPTESALFLVAAEGPLEKPTSCAATTRSGDRRCSSAAR